MLFGAILLFIVILVEGFCLMKIINGKGYIKAFLIDIAYTLLTIFFAALGLYLHFIISQPKPKSVDWDLPYLFIFWPYIIILTIVMNVIFLIVGLAVSTKNNSDAKY